MSQNPYDPENFETGGGLWDDKVVQVTGAKFLVRLFEYKDGSKVIDKETKEQAFANIIEIKGIAEGEEKERREEYSTGAMVADNGGESLKDPSGRGKQLHERSAAARFFKELKAAGYDTASLYPKISALVGARLLFKGEQLKDKDGKPKFSRDGKYREMAFWPVQVVSAGSTAGASAPAGNGLAELADTTVLGLLAETPKLTRAELVQKVSAKLAGNPDVNKVIALIVREDFHKGKAWSFSGTEISLGG
jgi:hypothetical protein